MNDDVSCRAIIPILEFAKKNGINANQLIKGLPLDAEYLEKPKNWLTRDWVVSIFYRCEEIFNDPLIMYKIGLQGLTNQTGAYLSFIRLLLRPAFFFKFFPSFQSLHTKFYKIQAKRIAKNQARFIVTYADNRMAHRHGCLFNLGWAAGFPPFVWRAESEVIERECACSHELDSINILPSKPKMIGSVIFGSNNCVVDLKWKKNLYGVQTKAFLDDKPRIIEDALDQLLKAELNSQDGMDKSVPFSMEINLSKFESLSTREAEVINIVLQGKKNSEIARHLQISPETVKKHLNNIYKKLSVKSRFELISKIHNHLN